VLVKPALSVTVTLQNILIGLQSEYVAVRLVDVPPTTNAPHILRHLMSDEGHWINAIGRTGRERTTYGHLENISAFG